MSFLPFIASTLPFTLVLKKWELFTNLRKHETKQSFDFYELFEALRG